MARSGPTIPIYIDIDTSAKEAIKKWDRYNKEFQRISSKYESSAKAAGMKKSEYEAMFKQMASYKTAMKGTVKTADEMRARIQALNATLNATNPNTKKWEKYAEKLRETKQKLADLEAKMRTYNTVATQTATKVDMSMGVLNKSFLLQDSYLGRLIARMAAYASIYQIASMLRKVRDVTAEFEMQKVALSSILRDSYKANQLFNRIKAAAVESPFQIKDLVSYTKQLSAYQIEEEKLFDTTMKLADISAGLGVDMQRLILAFGQVKAASVLRGQELRQFTEAGIPLVQALADKFEELNGRSYKTGEIFDLISKKAVSFEMVESVLNDMTEAGGMFYRMQEKQAKTLAGQFSNLKDAISIMYDEIGRSPDVYKSMEAVVRTLKSLASNWQSVIAVTKSGVAAFVAVKIAQKNARIAAEAYIGVLNAERIAEYELMASKTAGIRISQRLLPLFMSEIRAKKVLTVQTNMLAAAYHRASTATNIFSAATSRLTVALLSNPYALVIGLIAGLVMWMSRANDEAKTLQETTDDLQSSTQQYADALKYESDMSTLIDSYEELSQKESLTNKESVKLKDTTEQLAKAFPDAVAGVNEQTNAISLLTDKMRELNAQTREGLKNSLIEKVKRDEEVLKERQALNAQWSKEIGTGKSSMYNRRSSWLGRTFISKNKKVKDTVQFGELLSESILQAQDLERAIKETWDVINGMSESATEVEEKFVGWREKLAEFKYTYKENDKMALYTPDIAQNFENLDSALDDVIKKYKEVGEEVETLKKSKATSMEESVLQSINDDLEEATSRQQYLSQIISYFNAWSRVDAKKKNKDLTDLKQELKDVQDIYKKYQQLLNTMTPAEAAQQIESIYSSVTRIDFLNPEDYKKRLTKILAQINAATAKMVTAIHTVSTESVESTQAQNKVSEEYVEWLKKEEGLVLKVYQNRLRNGKLDVPTAGYGDTLHIKDLGLKVGDRITKEQAEAWLKEDLIEFEDGTIAALNEFGYDFSTMTQRQFEALVDYSFNKGLGSLKKLLKASEGDIEALSENIFTMAENDLAPLKRKVGRQNWFKGLIIPDDNETIAEFQTMMQDIYKLVQDVDFDSLTEIIAAKIKRLSEDISHTKEAREFFDDIFGMTGNADLSAVLAERVFGSDGKNLEDLLKQQLTAAFSNASYTNLAPDIKDEFMSMYGEDLPERVGNAILMKDWVTLRKMLELLPDKAKETAKTIVDEGIKADAQWLLDFEKTYAKAKTYAERTQVIKDTAEKKRQEISDKVASGALDSEDAASRMAAVTEKETRDLAALDLEILKNSEDWEKAFGDIERLGKTSITDLISLIDKLIDKYKKAGSEGESYLSDEAIKNLEQTKTKLTGELEGRMPFQTFVEGLSDYISGTKAIAALRKELSRLDKESEEYEATVEALKKAEDRQRKGLDKMRDSVGVLNKGLNQISNVLSSLQQFVDALGLDDDSDTAAVLKGIAEAATILGTALMFVNGVLDLLYANPLVLAAAAIATALISIVTVLSNLKVNKANKEIEKQNKLLKNLEESYDRLNKMMDKTFGSDYIVAFNQTLENMKARVEAYQKQADAEASKGKKADDDKVEDYRKSARELLAEIEDLQNGLSEHFSGTDLTSSARDFASAWIDAYKEFSSTTDAMSEKFNDMVQSMIVESLAARAMQGLLQPIFDAIDEAAQSGTELTAEEISAISDMASTTIPQINEAMTSLMNELAASGYNIRASATGLSGISKDIATASEESILGLAAGINTQNFYIAQTNEYVFQILSILKNGAAAAISSTPTTTSDNQVDNYLSYLPTIADHTSQIVRHCEAAVETCQSIATDLKRVIQPRGTTGTHWMVTN